MSGNPYVLNREQRTRELMKRLRHQVATLSIKRLLTRLDYSDRMLLVQLLEDLVRRVEYLHHLDKSTCSIVLEACDIHYKGKDETDILRHMLTAITEADQYHRLEEREQLVDDAREFLKKS